MFDSEKQRVLIVVKAYPEPSRSAGESSCTAGITEDGRFVRWFPLNHRRLPTKMAFHKYDWVEGMATKSRDHRPESFVPQPETLKVVGSESRRDSWAARRRFIHPLVAGSMEELWNRQSTDRTSLGVVKVRELVDFRIEPTAKRWREEQAAYVAQLDLFQQEPHRPLEEIPYQFEYRWLCQNDECRTHTQITVDWEVHESYRKWGRRYPDDWERRLREKYLTEMAEKDLHFFVGTMFQHPSTWIIIGNFYPPRDGGQETQAGLPLA